MTDRPKFTAARTLLPFGSVLVLVLVLAACGDGEPPETGTPCAGGWSDVDEAIEQAEERLDFDVLVPTYLPATTALIPEGSIDPPEKITLAFYPCPDTTTSVLGPRVVISQGPRAGGLPEPEESDPPTERAQIAGTPVLMDRTSSGKQASISTSWRQAGLSLFVSLTWESRDSRPPEITADMEREAIRVVESIIQQSDVTESAR